MSQMLTKTICKAGLKCAFHKQGKCKFFHGISSHKSASNAVVAAKNGKTVKQLQTVLKAHLDQVKTLKSSVMGAYFDTKDAKSVDGLKEQIDLLRGVARAALGTQKVRTRLMVKTSITGGAGTALAGSVPLVPSGSAEWTSYVSLYDEVRVTGLKIHFYWFQTVISAANNDLGYAVGYDPTYNSTPASVVDVMESEYHKIGAISPWPGTSTTGFTATVEGGMRTMSVVIPLQTVMNSTTVTGGTGINNNFPGSWMACGDPTDSVGYLRYYGEQPTGTGIWRFQYFVEFECEFRIRT